MRTPDVARLQYIDRLVQIRGQNVVKAGCVALHLMLETGDLDRPTIRWFVCRPSPAHASGIHHAVYALEHYSQCGCGGPHRVANRFSQG